MCVLSVYFRLQEIRTFQAAILQGGVVQLTFDKDQSTKPCIFSDVILKEKVSFDTSVWEGTPYEISDRSGYAKRLYHRLAWHKEAEAISA